MDQGLDEATASKWFTDWSTWWLNLRVCAEHKKIVSSPQVPVKVKNAGKQPPGRRVHRWFIGSHQHARHRFCSSHVSLSCCMVCVVNNMVSTMRLEIHILRTKHRRHWIVLVVCAGVWSRWLLPETADTTGILGAVYAMYRNPPNNSLRGCSLKCLRYCETSSNSSLELPTKYQKSCQISHS